MSDSHSTYSQGLNMPALGLICFVTAAIVYLAVLGVQAYYEAGVQEQEQIKLIDVRYDDLEDLREAQTTALAGSIEQGKAQVIARYGRTDTPVAANEHTGH